MPGAGSCQVGQRLSAPQAEGLTQEADGLGVLGPLGGRLHQMRETMCVNSVGVSGQYVSGRARLYGHAGAE
jgi:hypothetical protein